MVSCVEQSWPVSEGGRCCVPSVGRCADGVKDVCGEWGWVDSADGTYRGEEQTSIIECQVAWKELSVWEFIFIIERPVFTSLHSFNTHLLLHRRNWALSRVCCQPSINTHDRALGNTAYLEVAPPSNEDLGSPAGSLLPPTGVGLNFLTVKWKQ